MVEPVPVPTLPMRLLFNTCLGPVSQKGLRPGASLVRTKSGPIPQNQTKFRIFNKKKFTCNTILVKIT